MKKAMIGIIVLVLLTSLVMANTREYSAIPQPINGGSGDGGALIYPIEDDPIDWPSEPTTPVQTNSGGGHKEVIECQEGIPCTVTICDDRIEANKDGIRYMFTVRHSYQFDGDVISVCTNEAIGIMSFVEMLLIEPSLNGCYEVIV